MTTAEEPQNGERDIQWEYFVTPNKQASRVFDELCRGLAQIIRRLEPISSHGDLSPRQLSNFYRSCGSNYDELFTNTGEHGLSWIYRTMGCYQSLQPTQNPFETPSIPCLTEDGYVRWQTIQLLLCPHDHIALIQKAVEIFDVPQRGGGYFPKTIPRECFPPKPDAEMEKWHRFVTSQIDKETYMRRLKYSPYNSPLPEGNRSDGYFVSHHARKPSAGYKRGSASEEELARREAARRSSVPDIGSPGPSPYADRDSPYYSRSQSAHRPNSGVCHARQRSNGGTPTHYYTPPSSRLSGSASRRSDTHLSADRRDRRRELVPDRNISSSSRQSSADDASSEDSYNRPQRLKDEDSKRKSRWSTSLMPSFFLSKSQRRHSSDGRVPTLKENEDRPLSRRNDSIKRYRTEELSRPGVQFYNHPIDRPVNVRFEDPLSPGTTTAPPVRPDEAYAPPPSSYRHSDAPPPTINTQQIPNLNQIPPTPPGTGSAQFFEENPPPLPARKQGIPLRVATVSGVNGRRYAPPGSHEPQSAGEPYRSRDRTNSMRNPATSTVH